MGPLGPTYIEGYKIMDIGFKGLTALGFGFEDYQKMFNLGDDELKMRILDCRGGASGFAASANKQGYHVVAADPLYAMDFASLKALVEDGTVNLKQSLAKQAECYEIKTPNVDTFLEAHEQSTQDFLNDFAKGKDAGRYVAQKLPNYSFEKETFDLALVCHYLFTYSKELDLAYHLKAIDELLRVANEVRIFPLVTESGELSPLVGEVVATAQLKGFGAELKGVDYNLQAKGNAMLRLFNPSCSVEKHED